MQNAIETTRARSKPQCERKGGHAPRARGRLRPQDHHPLRSVALLRLRIRQTARLLGEDRAMLDEASKVASIPMMTRAASPSVRPRARRPDGEFTSSTRPRRRGAARHRITASDFQPAVDADGHAVRERAGLSDPPECRSGADRRPLRARSGRARGRAVHRTGARKGSLTALPPYRPWMTARYSRAAVQENRLLSSNGCG